MKKRNLSRKKLITLIMTLSLLLLLVGCGGKEESDKAGDQGGTSTETNGEDPFAFDSVSDVTFPLEEKLELSVFVYATDTGGGTYQDNYVTDWIEEQTNIHLNFVYDLDGDEAKTRLNLLMTDPDSLPDVFLTTHWSKSEVQSYGEQGLIIPLDEYLADAPRWNEINEMAPNREGDLVMSDGHIYTYGDCNECFHCRYQNRMWIYKPWVDSLNDGKMPETTEELYDFLVKVKNEDPNGNGIADEIPMTGFLGGWATDPTVWMINSFVQANNPLSNTNPTVGAGLVVSDDGTIEYSVMKEEYREAMKYINKLYAEGLLDNQTFTQDNTQFVSALDNEEDNLVALHPGGALQVDGDNFWSKSEGKWQDWEILEPVEGPNGVRLAAKNLDNYFGSTIGSISKNCEYPEIVVALFDFLATEEGTNVQAFGAEGIGWDWTDEGVSLAGGTPTYEAHVVPDDFDWIGAGFEKNYDNWYWVSDACVRSSTADFRGDMKIQEPVELDHEYVLQQSAEKYDPFSPDDESIVPNLVFEGEDAQFISESTVTIGGYVNQATVEFITGGLDPEADWDLYISNLKDMGVERYLETYQTYYDQYMENLQ